LQDGNAKGKIMTLPIRKATPAELETAKLNKMLYGDKTAPTSPRKATPVRDARGVVQNERAQLMAAKQALIDAKANRPPMTPRMPPNPAPTVSPPPNANFMRKGGAVRSKPQTNFASGGSVGSASKRGDGIAQRGKTKGRMC